MATCETCRFWDNSSTLQDAENTGQCRRRAPRIDKRSGQAIWPYSEDNDWCGSYDADPTKAEHEGIV